MKSIVATCLRAWADRLDFEHAIRISSFTWTFERGIGIKLREDGRGCPILYRSEDYDRAHDEADSA